MTKTKNESKENSKELAAAPSASRQNILSRGRTFKGIVVKKFPTRVVVEFGRTVFVPKYESFYNKKTRIHARLPQGLDVNIGDYVKVSECRPLSKIIHHIVTERIVSTDLQDVSKSQNPEEKK